MKSTFLDPLSRKGMAQKSVAKADDIEMKQVLSTKTFETSRTDSWVNVNSTFDDSSVKSGQATSKSEMNTSSAKTSSYRSQYHEDIGDKLSTSEESSSVRNGKPNEGNHQRKRSTSYSFNEAFRLGASHRKGSLYETPHFSYDHFYGHGTNQQTHGSTIDKIDNVKSDEKNMYNVSLKPQALSKLVVNRRLKPTSSYFSVMMVHRPLAVLLYCIFLILSPFVFRFAMASFKASDISSTGSWNGSSTIQWFHGLQGVDWVIITALLLDAFNQILRFLPLLSGGPTELNRDRDVVVYGRAVLSTVSPFATEKEGIFLRNLIGRTATALHTVGSRHNIRTLYIDAIANEAATNLVRYQQWKAWIEFLQFLCSFNTDDMEWKSTWRKSNPDAPQRIVTVGQGISKYFLCDPSAIDFAGCKDFEMDKSTETEQSQSLSIDNYFRGCPNLSVKMVDILPLVCFLDGWLEQIKVSESSWPNYNHEDTYKLALQSIFTVAPCQKYFSGKNLMMVLASLENLHNAFSGMKSNPVAGKSPIYRDFNQEVSWRVYKGENMPPVDIAWVYFSRSKLDCDLPNHITSCTAKVVQSIVYIKPDVSSSKPTSNLNANLNIRSQTAVSDWLQARSKTYQIVSINREGSSSDPIATIMAWPPAIPLTAVASMPTDLENSEANFDTDNYNRNDSDNGRTRQPSLCGETILVPLSKLDLISKNRGKAGALNTFLEYSRARTKAWCHSIGHNDSLDPVQRFLAVVDARHMLAEPEVFWNSALPYFSCHQLTGEFTSGANQQTILVQYPQYFSNVGSDNYLDNKNSFYYVISQTLRDCSKVITSSGTNAIWDVSDSDFVIASTCRIEDTATTQNFLENYNTIHLPIFVANGIAKDTRDYIEALYRWSAGAVELFWWTVKQPSMVRHFMIVGIFFLSFLCACMHPNALAYYAWWVLLASAALSGYIEKRSQRMPFRFLNVSAVIVHNSLSYLSNLTSVVWLIVSPVSISIFKYVPLANTGAQALTWSFSALILRVLPTLIVDQIIVMARFLSPEVANPTRFNFTLELWRSNQAYVAAFAYTLLAIICGTITAFFGHFYYQDNTFWNSFKSKNVKLSVAVTNTLTSPAVLTSVFILLLLVTQLICLASAMILSFENSYLILLTVAICGFNLMLLVDIALLLFPVFSNVHFARPEHAFALIAIFTLIGAVVGGFFPADVLEYIMSNQ